MPRLPRPSLAALAFALVLVVRALVALSRLDEIELELYGGSLAVALLKGMPLDPAHLPVIVHLRGSVVMALLAVPAIAVLGAGLGSLKAVAVLWSACTAWLLVRILERCAGRAAALVGGLLVAFLPPSYQIVDVLALGSHGETLLPILAALAWLLPGPGPERSGPLGARQVAVAGLLLGAGLLFSMQFLVALPGLVLVWALRDPRFWRRRSLLALPLGMLPFLALIPVLTRSTTLVNKPLGAHFLPDGVGAGLDKLGRLLVDDGRRSWLFEENGGAWASWLLLAALLVGLVLCLRRLRGPKGVDPLLAFLFVYPLCFCAAFAISDFTIDFINTLDGIGSRYLMPVLPCVLAWIAIGAGGLWSGGRRAAAAVLAAAAVVPGVVGWASLLDPGLAWRQPRMQAARFSTFQHHFEHAGGADLRERLAWILGVDPDWSATHPLCYECIALPDPRALENHFQLAKEVDRIRKCDPSVRPYLLVELGRRVGRNPRTTPFVGELTTLEGRVTDEELRWLVQGAVKEVAGRMLPNRMLGGRSTLVFQYIRGLPPELQRPAVEGLGFAAGHLVSPYSPALIGLLADGRLTPEGMHAAYWRAAGLGFRRRFVEADWFLPAPGALRIEGLLPPEAVAPFREGLALPHDRVPDGL